MQYFYRGGHRFSKYQLVCTQVLNKLLVMDLQVLTIACFFFLGVTRAAQLDSSTNAKILKYDYKNDAAGHYFFEYQTSDGQAREETGDLKNAETKHEELVVKGSYSFTGADGVVYTVTYTADKDGFHPEGDHIKVPPYMPWPVNQYSDFHTDTSDEYSNKAYPPAQRPKGEPFPDNNKVNRVFISTPAPKLSNAYIPSTPSPKYFDYTPNQSNGISRAYIPSTPGPFQAVITDTHLGAGSSQVKVTKRVSKRPVQSVTA